MYESTITSSNDCDLQEIVRADSTSVAKRNLYGWTALLYAAYLGHEPAVAFLLDRGAKADECNDKGQTALMLAAACGNLKVGIVGNLLTLAIYRNLHIIVRRGRVKT